MCPYQQDWKSPKVHSISRGKTIYEAIDYDLDRWPLQIKTVTLKPNVNVTIRGLVESDDIVTEAGVTWTFRSWPVWIEGHQGSGKNNEVCSKK